MNNALKTAGILLPRPGIDLSRWAVVACDQFTAQPEYWAEAESAAGDAPSALRLTLPEIWLDQADARVPGIHDAMARYLDEGILAPAVRDGFVLVERQTSAGIRPGLVVALDLEEYAPDDGRPGLIRATEGTVPERVPPRAKIRRGAPLELPHVMMLIDDPAGTVIEPLLARSASLCPLYDFELMLGGGHIRGWAVEGADAKAASDAVDGLLADSDGLLYAVGDGNHSLAAACACWREIRDTLAPEAREGHPARYALVELVNLNCPALVFEPIHRVLFGVDAPALAGEFRRWLEERGAYEGEGGDLIAIDGHREWRFASSRHPLRALQTFLDGWLAGHPEASIDYIHGEDALRALVGTRDDALGFMPRAFEKAELFPHIRAYGPLPRKTFSMGEARDKRYYLEARRILP